VIDQLAADLRHAFPEMQGFSPRNLKYMRAFAEAWPDEAMVQQAAAQIPWFHSCILLDKLKDPAEREWYIHQTIANGWSRNVLVHQIGSGLYRRQNSAWVSPLLRKSSSRSSQRGLLSGRTGIAWSPGRGSRPRRGNHRGYSRRPRQRCRRQPILRPQWGHRRDTTVSRVIRFKIGRSCRVRGSMAAFSKRRDQEIEPRGQLTPRGPQ
jgi:DUF1016 N-terminal domain